MKSLYGRQFLLTAGMILISFALLGTSFIALTYRYTIQDTRNSMERNVDDVASFTGSSFMPSSDTIRSITALSSSRYLRYNCLNRSKAS